MFKCPAVVVMMLLQTIFSVLLFVVVDSLLLLVLFVVISLFTQQTHSYRDGCDCIPVVWLAYGKDEKKSYTVYSMKYLELSLIIGELVWAGRCISCEQDACQTTENILINGS